MKANLLLITNGFPFGESERGFLPDEFRLLTERFHVTVLAKTPTPPPEAWEQLDFDRNRVFCTGNEALKPLFVLRQLFRRETLTELRLAWAPRQSLRMRMQRLSAIVRWRARAAQYEKIIDRLCTQQQIDLIYTYWCTQATLGASLVQQRRPQLKLVVRFHGYDLYQERAEALWQPFRHLTIQQAQLLVFACQTGLDYFRSHWPATPEEKMVVAYLGSSAMEPASPASDGVLHLVSCSNLIPLKRVGLLIEALAVLPEQIRVDWHHFGDGVLRGTLEQQARTRLGSRAHITWTFHGAIPNSQLNQLYQQLHAEVFVTLSETEGGVPVSMQEALAMGIPTIGTQVGGIPELILPGETGWLLRPDLTASEAAAALTEAARLSPHEMERMRTACLRHWAAHFNRKENADRFTQLLCTIAQSKDEL